MKNQILSEEFTRMQKLAGIISEIKATNPNDVRFLSALGTLFNYSNEDPDYPYEWDDKEIRKLVKSLGYKDWKGVASEVTHYFSPDDEDFLATIRDQEDRPDLQVEDLTIGMIIKDILKEFSYELGEPIEADSYVPKVKDVEVDNSFKTKQNPKLAKLLEKYKDMLIDKFGLDKSKVKVLDSPYYDFVFIANPFGGSKSVSFWLPEDWEKEKNKPNNAKDIELDGIKLKYVVPL